MRINQKIGVLTGNAKSWTVAPNA